jgi:hypothetical protein
MGMIGNYLRVSKDELEEYLNDSSKLEDRVYSEKNYPDKNLMDVDKSWEGIFYLLNGQALATSDEAAPPLSWTLLAPQEIDPNQDLGYGPATYTTIDQTREVSAALNGISADELKAKYDGKIMNELGIYPEVWDNNESLEYLIDNYTSLKDFYYHAVKDSQAVIIFIN